MQTCPRWNESGALAHIHMCIEISVYIDMCMYIHIYILHTCYRLWKYCSVRYLCTYNNLCIYIHSYLLCMHTYVLDYILHIALCTLIHMLYVVCEILAAM